MNSLWKGKPSLGRKREDTIKRFSKWGGKYLDKSNKGDYEKYRKLASKEIDVSWWLLTMLTTLKLQSIGWKVIANKYLSKNRWTEIMKQQ